jgi:hypothetical protein
VILSIELKLEGFDEMLKQIQKAEGDIIPACEKCAKISGDIMNEELTAQMLQSNVPSNLVADLPAPSVENDFGLITTKAGYKKGAYDPHNLSTGYKVLFLNYGTPHRKEHGVVQGRFFIDRAKRKAKTKIRKAQKDALHEILKGL